MFCLFKSLIGTDMTYIILCRCAVKNLIYFSTQLLSLAFQMTSGEIKFALQVEMVLNRIPQPEYRQLMVEGMMVLIMIVSHDSTTQVTWDHIIHINEMVKKANAIFIDEQVRT